jgi:hypothetical protein
VLVSEVYLSILMTQHVAATSPEKEDVYVTEELTAVLGPHQIEGIKFLWKNTVSLCPEGSGTGTETAFP